MIFYRKKEGKNPHELEGANVLAVTILAIPIKVFSTYSCECIHFYQNNLRNELCREV